MKVKFRLACPGDDPRAYLVYEEEMKVRSKQISRKEAKGFYWTDEVYRHPIMEPLSGVTTLDGLKQAFLKVQFPSNDDLPEGYHYQAVHLSMHIEYDYGNGVTTNVEMTHMITKESYTADKGNND